MNIERRGGAVGDFPSVRTCSSEPRTKKCMPRLPCSVAEAAATIPYDHHREKSRLLDENLVRPTLYVLFGIGYTIVEYDWKR